MSYFCFSQICKRSIFKVYKIIYKRKILEKENLDKLHYTFRNVQGNTSFRLLADGFYSDDYTLTAVPNPVLVDFSVELNYPAYLGRKNETIKNTGDLLIPAGTRATWNIGTQNTRELRIRFADSTYT